MPFLSCQRNGTSGKNDRISKNTTTAIDTDARHKARWPTLPATESPLSRELPHADPNRVGVPDSGGCQRSVHKMANTGAQCYCSNVTCTRQTSLATPSGARRACAIGVRKNASARKQRALASSLHPPGHPRLSPHFALTSHIQSCQGQGPVRAVHTCPARAEAERPPATGECVCRSPKVGTTGMQLSTGLRVGRSAWHGACSRTSGELGLHPRCSPESEDSHATSEPWSLWIGARASDRNDPKISEPCRRETSR